MNYNDYLLLQQKIIADKNGLEKKSLKFAIVRLVVGSLVVIFLLSSYFAKIQWLTYLAFFSIAVFISAVYIHNKVTSRLNYLKAQSVVVQRYLDRFDSSWKKFEETGIDYLGEVNGVIKDLDIAGKNSLFQYLNVANSWRGKKRLLAKLTRIDFDRDLIINEQAAVSELADKPDFVINLETYGRMLEKPQTIEKVIEDFVLEVTKTKFTKSWKAIRYIIPFLTIVSIIMFVFEIYFKLAVIMVPVLIFGQLIVAIINLNKSSVIFEQITKLSPCLQNYQNIAQLVENTNFNCKHLKQLKKDLARSRSAFDEIGAISSAVKQRNNLLAFLLLNGILLWDVNCKERYDNWVKQYADLLDQWLNAISELESLASLQVVAQTKENISFAKIENNSKTVLNFVDAYHPLIQDDKVVANTFTMNKQVAVITGSNMSGKTTFLRTIGINLVLAYAGGPVLAKSFDCSLMRIYTSMRIEDDLNGISSFYAELLRIKEIVEANRKGGLMIALIDEIFKGTNSKDRIIGAQETVKQLSTKNIFTFITTHDFELCELEHQVSCDNYHFNEYYQDKQIMFDYLIKQGRSNTTNAQYLLKMVGITK